MKRLVFYLIIIFLVSSCSVQEKKEEGIYQGIKEEFILDVSKDSSIIKDVNSAFDLNGSYCLESKRDSGSFWITDKGIIIKSGSSTYGNTGGMSESHSAWYQFNKPTYYRNTKSTKIFGPVFGNIENYMESNTRNNIAISTLYKDMVHFYVNGKLVSKNQQKELPEFYFHIDWCAFSENGNSIYYIRKGGLCYLYVNDKMIDQSLGTFSELRINNNGYYTYTKLIGNDNNYICYVHSKDTSFRPMGGGAYNDLTESNSYYYSDSDYIIVNNRIFKGIKDVSNITLLENGNYLFTYGTEDNKINSINVKGKDYTFDFDSIQYPVVDKDGTFSFYGIKNYHLYKCINGVVNEKPITKFGVRPIPLYISPKGESLHLYKTKDSLYLYRDEKELFRQAENLKWETTDVENILPYEYSWGKAKYGNSLSYLELDNSGYFIFNGILSKPMFPALNNLYYKDKIGAIVAGELKDHGYFIIQKIGPKKFLININNTIYREIDIDYLLRDNFYFNKKQLVFFGAKGLSIYKYTIEI